MRSAIKRRTVLGSMSAASVAALAGCVDDDDPEEVADDDEEVADDDEEPEEAEIPDDPPALDELRVGALLPVTGDLGDLGAPIADAATLPGVQLEEEGVDFEIDIQVADTETEPAVGVEQAQALVDDGYPSVTGAASSGVTIEVFLEVLEQEEVVGISPASTSPDITDLDGRWLLRTTPTDALQGIVAAELAFEDEGFETASTFYLNNAYGQGLNDSFVENFEDLGGEVFEQEAFEPEQPSYDSELEVVLADDPDLLYVVGYPDSGEQIFTDFYENFDGDETSIIVADGMQSDDLPGDVDNPMSNVLGTAPAPVGPGRETFDQLYEDEFETDPGVFTAQAYDATAVHMLAQARVGEHDGPSVSAAVREVANPGGEVVEPSTLADGLEMAQNGEEIEYQGASSAVEFDENGDLDAATFEVFEFDIDGYSVTEQVEL